MDTSCICLNWKKRIDKRKYFVYFVVLHSVFFVYDEHIYIIMYFVECAVNGFVYDRF